jgi:phosphoribosyl 1,2-cyclic phosphodiesterase
MKIHVWGSRGNCPVPGSSTVEYGGNTSCVEIVLSDGSRIILDAGSGLRNLGKRILKERMQKEIHMFLTHAHWDHISGLPYFAPLFSPEYSVVIHAGPIDKEQIRKQVMTLLSEPYFPAQEKRILANLQFARAMPMVQRVGSAELQPIALNHPDGGYGFKIIDQGDTFLYMPDNELEGREYPDGETYYEYVQRFKNTDLLFHDAQFTPEEFANRRGQGHSSFVSALNIAMTAGVKRLGLFHHDPERTDDQLDKLDKLAKDYVERNESKMSVFVVREGMEIDI